jgi:uncharacterized Zn finger protein (UPF0148 family)
MTRVSCPSCGKNLKLPKESSGGPVACPRCGELLAAPAAPAAPAARPAPQAGTEEEPGPFSRISPGGRAAVVSLAAVCFLGLMLAVWRPNLPGNLGPFPAGWGVIIAVASFSLGATIIYGQATRCPACGKWWSRSKLGAEFLDRELYDGEDGTHARAKYQATYMCADCHHRWSVVETEDYKAPARSETQRSERAM